jgi:hypothetical protein
MIADGTAGHVATLMLASVIEQQIRAAIVVYQQVVRWLLVTSVFKTLEKSFKSKL